MSGVISVKKRIKYNKLKTKKKRICSPMVKKKGLINKESCLTPNILILIKKEFNKVNPPNNRINSDNIKEIWYELKKKMNCNKNSFDDCWYNKIKNIELRNKIEKYIFAPTHPKSWNKNPNEWLSNYDILKILKQYEITYPYFKFFEPTTIDFDLKLSKNRCISDELCNINIIDYIRNKKSEFGFIFNLDTHEGGGTHWVSLYFSFTDKYIFYFNSSGESIPKEIRDLKNRIIKQINDKTSEIIKFYQNAPYDHQKGNNECGMYSLYFITTMLTKKIDNKLVDISTLIKYFKGKYNGRITDKKMNDMRWNLFNSPKTI